MTDTPKPWAREPVEITGVSNPTADMEREIAALRSRLAAAEAERDRMREALTFLSVRRGRCDEEHACIARAALATAGTGTDSGPAVPGALCPTCGGAAGCTLTPNGYCEEHRSWRCNLPSAGRVETYSGGSGVRSSGIGGTCGRTSAVISARTSGSSTCGAATDAAQPSPTDPVLARAEAIVGEMVLAGDGCPEEEEAMKTVREELAEALRNAHLRWSGHEAQPIAYDCNCPAIQALARHAAEPACAHCGGTLPCDRESCGNTLDKSHDPLPLLWRLLEAARAAHPFLYRVGTKGKSGHTYDHVELGLISEADGAFDAALSACSHLVPPERKEVT